MEPSKSGSSPSRTPSSPKKSNKLNYILAVFAVILISGFIGAKLQSNNSGINSVSLSHEKKVISKQSQLISQIAKTVGPSVVSVNVDISSADNSAQTQLLDLYGYSSQAPAQTQQAAGTGIIISADGLIVTNRHVVPEGTTSVSITLSDGTKLKDVKVLGRTNASDSLDVAFLKITDTKGHKLSPATLGNSADVEVGDDAIAIGNALGQFQNTVTSGIISGYGRSVQAGDSSGSGSSENLENLFQTDAAINEGNSGGPLVNLNGQVIGINTAVAGNAQNIGFAIPINDVKGLIGQVAKTGKFARPYLGIRYVPLTADVAATYGLKVQQGIFIVPSGNSNTSSVVAGSPADKAGLQESDIITSINGTKIDQTHSLTSLLNSHQPGDKVELSVLRDGKTKTISIELGTASNSNN